MGAVKRRPDIQLSGLEWGIPGWVQAAGGLWSEANIDYLAGWATGLRERKGLNLTQLAVAYNEETYNASFIKAMRRKLDSEGLAHVRTIAPDSWEWVAAVGLTTLGLNAGERCFNFTPCLSQPRLCRCLHSLSR